MAKKIKILYDRINDYLKKYQSGFDTIDDFNGKLYQVQYEFANYLISILAKNERVQDFLDPLIISKPVTASSTGILPKPEGFMHYLSGSYMGKPIHKVTVNQLDTFELIPQRRGDLTKKRINITSINQGWEARPSVAFATIIRYVKHPPEAIIIFTEEQTEDEDLLVYNDADTIDFVWGEDCINILLYMMLEKVGISTREQLLNEYSRLGLAKEAA